MGFNSGFKGLNKIMFSESVFLGTLDKERKKVCSEIGKECSDSLITENF